jgi:poly(hydroxyalkanoate) depolymerase family esterase
VSLADNIDFLKRLPKSGHARGRLPVRSPLTEVLEFGANPGGLRMFAFVPSNLQQPRALVVVLHGCGQTAAGYDLGAGWSTLARHYGFALLMPQQQPANNANGCFNWFNPDDSTREHGEAASIRQMIARMTVDHGIDSRRVFVTGLSAGGAMTSVMLATYPEVFAAGAIIAGLPFGVASNAREALTGMRGWRARSPHELGDLVRNASHHSGQRRPCRQSGERRRDRQAVARRASPAAAADVGRRRQRPPAPPVVEYRRRHGGGVLHHHRDGAWHAARPRR